MKATMVLKLVASVLHTRCTVPSAASQPVVRECGRCVAS